MIYGSIAGVVGLAFAVSLLLPRIPIGVGGGDTEGPGQLVATLPANHIAPEETYNGYNTTPPTSGPHYAVAAPYGISSEPIPNEYQVHNLEHGAVTIQYNTEDSELVSQIEGFSQSLPNFPQCMIVAPYPDMETTIALTAWGRILTLDAFDPVAMGEFVDAYRGRLGPEAGVCRQES